MIWNYPDKGAPTAPYPVFRLNDIWACETADGTLALTGRLPWGQWPPFFTDLPYKRIHYTPFRGWKADLWHDGPEFIVEGGAVQACVLPGTDAELPPARQSEGFAAWWKERGVFAWKKSLAQAFRARVDHGVSSGSCHLQGLNHDPGHLLVLLGLRLAFPHTVFYTLDYPSVCAPQWKRCCQNLNLSTWAAPSQLRGLPSLAIPELGREWPASASMRFLQELNTRIPFVPGKLIESFNSP